MTLPPRFKLVRIEGMWHLRRGWTTVNLNYPVKSPVSAGWTKLEMLMQCEDVILKGIEKINSNTTTP